jgi:hypothetical protein
MKKYYAFISFALLLSLYIYMIYRAEQTVVNLILFKLFDQKFIYFKTKFIYLKNIPDCLRFSLPGALWLFAATLLLRNLYFKRFHLAFLPLCYVFFLEFLQYFHFTNGRFDTMDLAISSLFFFFAFAIKCPFPKQMLYQKPFGRSFLAVFAFAILYLAEFWCV